MARLLVAAFYLDALQAASVELCTAGKQDPSRSEVCCSKFCSVCGGTGCESVFGGAKFCCGTTFKDQCATSTGPPPCIYPKDYAEIGLVTASTGTTVAHALTSSNLETTAGRIMERFSKACLSRWYLSFGMYPSESFALMSAAVATDVDVMIEIGMGAGQNAECMARFFNGTSSFVYTIEDWSEANHLAGLKASAPRAARRLKAYKNVEVVWGDGYAKVPKLLDKLQGKRIGIMVDGPGHFLGVQLCIKAFQSKDVKFCGLHDVGKDFSLYYRTAGILEAWTRTALLTYTPRWRAIAGHLDAGVPAEHKHPNGPGLVILAGTESLPWGTEIDLVVNQVADLQAEIKNLMDVSFSGQRR